MVTIRSLIVVGLLALSASTSVAEPDEAAAATKPAAVKGWESVKLAVARNRVASHGYAFASSLRWWADEREGRTYVGAAVLRVPIDKDVTEELSVPGSNVVVHIRGNLMAPLRVSGDRSEVVIGGRVGKQGRIDAGQTTFIHVQGDVDGVISCPGLSRVWVGGSVRGEILTGQPSTCLHVRGDLTGSVRPLDKAAMLSIDVRGRADSSVLIPIDAHQYSELAIAVGLSDLSEGLHALEASRGGFFAVTGPLP